MNILLLNCFSRNALAVAENILPEYRVIGGTVKKTRFIINPDKYFISKKINHVARYTDPDSNEKDFIEDICQICDEYSINLIIPTGTRMTNAVSRLKPQIETQTQATVAVDDYQKLEQATDKWLCYLLAKRTNVSMPKTYLIEQDSTPEEVEREIGLPLVIKPRLSYASKGVQFVRTSEELIQALKDSGDKKCIAQECIAGQLHDVTSCSRNGQAFAMLTQQRVVSLYDFGGGGIVNLTTREPKLMALAKQIISDLSWNGILQFDFIQDEDGDFYLLECNPKFWGTTQLTISAGLNVAQYTVDVFTQKEVPEHSLEYQDGILYRWIFPECVFHWVHKPFNLKNFIRRFNNTFKNYGAKQTLNNLQWRYIPHLLGIVLNSRAR